MNYTYIIELEPNVWLAEWEGDPGRTVVKENALKFCSMSAAYYALSKATKYREFPSAKIVRKSK